MITNIAKLSLCKLNTLRCYATTTAKATDPIQLLFLKRIREYRDKSNKAEFGLVDATPDTLKTFKDSLERVEQIYNMKDADAKVFPTFDFKDEPLDDPRPTSRLTIPVCRQMIERDCVIDSFEDVSEDMEILG